jgi:glyoxylase-like metal-dependent hydrolase (beta-lactamase superfamily II)
MSLKYTVIPVTPYQQNCSLVWCDVTRQAALIDPGGDIERLLGAVARQELSLDKIILTHGHVDHVGGVAALAERLGLPIEGPQREDAFLIDDLPRQSARFGFPRSEAFTPGRWLEDGDTVQVGEVVFKALHCPGHTPGHIILYQPEAQIVFVGDVLFKGSIGRTDFPRGDYDTLIDAIKGKLWPLGDEVTVVPGHGPLTTVGHERRANPYVGILA